uniref:NADH-ubiquinone oxidoreductase chain 3 n=1 Tax=Neofoleyellides sp. XM-2022 TaxID=3014012 RepID=A0A9E9JI73_9BILA|nr:NADH dehydrogenase subunit 3 [Neofoleyellides sp. XM-2022]
MLYFYDFIFIFFFSFIIIGLYFISCFISFKDYYFLKISSYECGFDLLKKGYFSFNVVFFSVVLMFIIFELEVVIFVFLIGVDVYSFLVFYIFFLYVLLSFYMEWYLGKLIWFN